MRVRAPTPTSDGSSSLRAMSHIVERAAEALAAGGQRRIRIERRAHGAEQRERLRVAWLRMQLLGVRQELPARRETDRARHLHVDEQALRGRERHFERAPDLPPAQCAGS